MFRNIALTLFISTFTSGVVFADGGAAFFAPTSFRLNSKVEDGFHFPLVIGASSLHGKDRMNFLDVGPWADGYTNQIAFEFGVSYAFDKRFDVGLQIPILFTSASVNFYGNFNDHFGLGFKLGSISSLYTTASLYPGGNWFLSLSPSLSLNRFGSPAKIHANAGLSGSNSSANENISPSKYLAGGQFSMGQHRDFGNMGLIASYHHAFGAGVVNSFIFDDSLTSDYYQIAMAFGF